MDDIITTFLLLIYYTCQILTFDMNLRFQITYMCDIWAKIWKLAKLLIIHCNFYYFLSTIFHYNSLFSPATHMFFIMNSKSNILTTIILSFRPVTMFWPELWTENHKMTFFFQYFPSIIQCKTEKLCKKIPEFFFDF